MWHCNTCSDVFASMNFISYRSIWQESSTLKPNLWILLLRILPLTHYSTSCCIITDQWSSGTYLGLEISSRFVLSLICHCIWEVLFAHSLELTELPYFLCWILYLFFKNYYPITTPRRTSYTQIHLMDPSLLHIGEDFFLIFSLQHLIVL